MSIIVKDPTYLRFPLGLWLEFDKMTIAIVFYVSFATELKNFFLEIWLNKIWSLRALLKRKIPGMRFLKHKTFKGKQQRLFICCQTICNLIKKLINGVDCGRGKITKWPINMGLRICLNNSSKLLTLFWSIQLTEDFFVSGIFLLSYTFKTLATRCSNQ